MQPISTATPKESKRWYSRRHWYDLRKLVLAREPICRICNRNPSTVADHVVPHLGRWELFADLSNLEGICKQCHDRKTAKMDRGFGHAPFAGARSEIPAAAPTGSREGKEFQSSTLSQKKLDKALDCDIVELLKDIPE